MNYYNEHDIKTAQWLQALIDQKLIPQGHVDTRSIVEVTPNDLRNYTQCHFFAGIGGWSLALQLAGIPATTRLWTGSCPCQPFSTAGKGLAQADERHLWPAFFDLIRQCRPPVVFGEQVASAIGKGWLDGISADLEAEGYACGAAVLGAHSVGAPHIRQRLYCVAHSQLQHERSTKPYEARTGDTTWLCEADGLAHAKSLRGGQGEPDTRRSFERGDEEQRSISICGSSNGSGLDDTRRPSDERRGELGDVVRSAGEEQGEARQRQRSRNADSDSVQDDCGLGNSTSSGQCGGGENRTRESAEVPWSGHQAPWSDSQIIHCRDGKTRRIPTEPAFFPLAHGIPARVVRLRGYGNAIVPQVAAEFIKAFYETQEDEDFC